MSLKPCLPSVRWRGQVGKIYEWAPVAQASSKQAWPGEERTKPYGKSLGLAHYPMGF